MVKNFSVLITGATGFIGSHLSRKMVDKGWDVHVLIRNSSQTTILGSQIQKMRIHTYDQTYESVDMAVKSAKPDVVFHLATNFLSAHKASDIGPLIEANISFGTKLAEAMRSHQIPYMVNTGTAWQHFGNKAYSPVNLYSATKQAFADILQYFAESGAFKVTTLEIFDSYGPLDPRKKLFYYLEEAFQQKKELSFSPGAQKIDLIYIDDIVRAFEIATERHQKNLSKNWETFMISSGRPITLKKLVQSYETILKRPLKILWGNSPYRPREVMEPWSKGKRLPGWTPKVSLKQGLALMLNKPT